MPFSFAMSNTTAQPGLDSLSKSFEPVALEAHWGPEWERRGYGAAGYRGTGAPQAGEPAFSIQLPPPNVTGTLHMGHAFNQTIMDSLTRYHRMRGFNTVWVPGTDHAGIATQIVVERQLQEQGISRYDMGPTPPEARKNFVAKVWEWKEKSGNTITTQMRRLGDSVDWSREYFTMDDKLSKVVTDTFVRLYQQGLIYRGKRLVNWDPVLQSAVSDLEVESVEANGKMHYITYPFADGPQMIDGVPQRGMTIATTRPETMMADGALAVHPEDERYRHLVGKQVELPLMGRTIPIIADDFVDREFGSGCVKITGAHDFNDYACALRHGLPLITIFTLDAHVNENGPAAYQGMDRFAARKAVVADLEANGYLVEIKPHKLMLPTCTRTGQVVEPMLTDQWFVAMSQPAPAGSLHPGKSITDVALEVVADGRVRQQGTFNGNPLTMAAAFPQSHGDLRLRFAGHAVGFRQVAAQVPDPLAVRGRVAGHGDARLGSAAQTVRVQRQQGCSLDHHHVQWPTLHGGLFDAQCGEQLGVAGAGAEHDALGADVTAIHTQTGQLAIDLHGFDLLTGQQAVAGQLSQPGGQAGHIQHQFAQAVDLALEARIAQRRGQGVALDLVDARTHGLAGEKTRQVAGQGAR